MIFQWLGVGLAAVGTVWSLRPVQDADPRFRARVEAPAYPGRASGPRVLIDEAHLNAHTSRGSYQPFADLIRHDGYSVAANRRKFTTGVLESARVLVIANALGVRGATQQVLNQAGLDRIVHLHADAFDSAETIAVREWVRQGGSLLLIADHAPCGEAAQSLAGQFGVTMTNEFVEDPVQHDTETGNPAFLLFSRENGLLLEHPITRGADEAEVIYQVLSFTGQALSIPAGAVPFLKLSDQAVEFPRQQSRADEARPARGLAQGLALQFGRGRVVVLGEAAMITAQVAQGRGQQLRFGMNRAGYDNGQLALNVMHWLTGLL